jgi:Tat protein secretion system quality control protein TatD with DNase activity
VLHLRGDISVIQRAQAILQEEMVPTLHRLYIHCYLGDMEEYETWIRLFPRTIFGVSPLTVVTPSCREFCRRADFNRLVLESDAPYLGRRAFDVLAQADYLASLRFISRRAVLGATAFTATCFFFN